jgi:hypothetical protein
MFHFFFQLGDRYFAGDSVSFAFFRVPLENECLNGNVGHCHDKNYANQDELL